MSALYLFGFNLKFRRDLANPHYQGMNSGVFLNAGSWEEAEEKLQKAAQKHDWVMGEPFFRSIIEREAIPHYQEDFLRHFDEAAQGGLTAFPLDPSCNLPDYPVNDPTLAAWSGDMHILACEVKPRADRDNSDGALGAVVTAMVRCNSWEEAEDSCLAWMDQNQWELVQFVDDMRQTLPIPYANLVPTEQTPNLHSAEWNGIHVLVSAWDEEDDEDEAEDEG